MDKKWNNIDKIKSKEFIPSVIDGLVKMGEPRKNPPIKIEIMDPETLETKAYSMKTVLDALLQSSLSEDVIYNQIKIAIIRAEGISSPIEIMVLDVVITDYLKTMFYENRIRNMVSGMYIIPHLEILERMALECQKRFLKATETLAALRKPTLNINVKQAGQLNIGEKQVNVSMQDTEGKKNNKKSILSFLPHFYGRQ